MLKPKLDHISILNVVFKYNSKKYSSINYESDNSTTMAPIIFIKHFYTQRQIQSAVRTKTIHNNLKEHNSKLKQITEYKDKSIILL